MMNVLTFLFPSFLTHFGQQNVLQMPRGSQLIRFRQTYKVNRPFIALHFNLRHR